MDFSWEKDSKGSGGTDFSWEKKGSKSMTGKATVEDGDTVYIKDSETGRSFRVRLSGIDAPETRHKDRGTDQDYGQKSAEYLRNKIDGKDITVNWDKLDDHGRIIGNIMHGKEDVNYDMVKSGNAHHYDKYDKDPLYAKAQENAKKSKLGLWSQKEDEIMSPEEFRRKEEEGILGDVKAFAKKGISALPAAAGGAAGMEAGAAVGSAIAPGPGTLIGGAVGAFAGSFIADKAADKASDIIPNEAKKVIGMDPAAMRVAEQIHPKSSFAGELASNTPFFGMGTGVKMGERALGAAVGAGIEAGQTLAQGDTPDPVRTAMAGAFQAVFPRPTKLTESIGARLTGVKPTAIRPEGKSGYEATYQGKKETVDTETGEIRQQPTGPSTRNDAPIRIDSEGKGTTLQERTVGTKDDYGTYPKGAAGYGEDRGLGLSKKRNRFEKQANALEDAFAEFDNAKLDTYKKKSIEQAQKEIGGNVSEHPLVDNILENPVSKHVEAAAVEAESNHVMDKSGLDLEPDRKVTPKERVAKYKEKLSAWAEDIKDRIGVTIDQGFKDAMAVHRYKYAMKTLVPEEADRIKIGEAMHRGTVDQLPEAHKQVVELYRNIMDKVGKKSLDMGIMKGWVENYVTRSVEMPKDDPGFMAKVIAEMEAKPRSAQETSRFGRSRTTGDFDSFVEAVEKAGGKIKTMDPLQFGAEYLDSMYKAQRIKELTNHMREVKDGHGMNVFIKPGDTGKIVPPGYKRLTGGQFDGYMVHPEIMPNLKWVMDAPDRSALVRALDGLSRVTKRINTSASLFHNTTLGIAGMFSNRPKDLHWWNPKAIYQDMRKQLTEKIDKGMGNGTVDKWIESGARFGTSEDVGKGAIEHLAKFADDNIAKYTGFKGDILSKGISPVVKFQNALDHATWNISHDGWKLMTNEALLEKAMRDHPDVSEKYLREQISQFTNTTFGGLDWYRMARDSSSKFEEGFKTWLYSPEGRVIFNIMEFAPDWTLSAIKSFTLALPKDVLHPSQWDVAGAFKGLYKPLTTQDYARRYQMRAALYAATIANGINFALSGHAIWNNKDSTTIELGDGTAVHWMKHAGEPKEWLQHPEKTFENKLGFVPRMFLKSKEETPQDFAKTLLKSVLPFSSTSTDPANVALGFMGLPRQGQPSGSIGSTGHSSGVFSKADLLLKDILNRKKLKD